MCYNFQRTFKLQIFILHYSFERVIMRLEALTNNMFDVQNIYKFIIYLHGATCLLI